MSPPVTNEEQQFLNDLDKKLWNAADRLRSNLDAAVYKHAVLAIAEELEERDYYTAKNIFWVPALARWENIKENCTLPAGTEITIKNGKKETYQFRSVGRLLDDALEAVERENPRLKGVIEKNRYSQLQLEASKLIGLISEVISSIPFHHKSLNAKDILGHVYEYFLGQFALAEGKKGGQYYTPKVHRHA
jgi:type I restriction enzyme M protein